MMEPEANDRKNTILIRGEIVIQRRVYPTADGLEVKADKELGLPPDKW